jgi:hypothetical protein
MHSAKAILGIILLCAVAACGEEPRRGRGDSTSHHPASVDAAPLQSIAVRVPFSVSGVPGPWWRDNAMREEFQIDQKSCRAVSAEARVAAPTDDRKDAAYRAFLECMAERNWRRGYPPKPEAEAQEA